MYAACLSILLAAGADVGAEPAAEPVLRQQIEQAEKAKDWRRLLELAADYLRRFSHEKHCDRVVRKVEDYWFNKAGTGSAFVDFHERQAVLQALRDLTRDDPMSPGAEQTIIFCERALGTDFSRTGSFLVFGVDRNLALHPGSSPPSSFTIYQIPLAEYAKSVNDPPPGEVDVDAVSLLVASSKRTIVGKQMVDFPRDREDRDRGETFGESIAFDIPAPGIYVLDEEIAGFHRYHSFRVGTFAFFSYIVSGKGIIVAVDQNSGLPLEGIDISIRMTGRTARGVTNKDGYLAVDGISSGVITARRGEEWHAARIDLKTKPPESIAHIATDRTVYRPGQTVHFRVIARQRDASGFSLPKGKSLPVEIRDGEGRLLEKREYEWSPFGTLAGSFRIGAEPPLGDYWIVLPLEMPDASTEVEDPEDREFSDLLDRRWHKRFTVAEYRKPEVKVSVSERSDPNRDDERVQVEIQAEYFIGGPVVGADVEWTVRQLRRYRYHEGELKLFNDPHEWFCRRFFERDDDFDDDEKGYRIEAGDGVTNSEGRLRIGFDAGPGDYLVTADVADDTRLVARGEGKVHIDSSEFLISLQAERQFFVGPDPISFFVVATDGSGNRVAGREVEFNATDWKSGSPILEGETAQTARTDDDGVARFSIPFPDRAIRHVIVYAKPKGARDSEHWPEHELKVRDGFAWFEDLDPVVERRAYVPGETIRVLMPAEEHRRLLVVEGATIHHVQLLPPSPKPHIVEFTAKAEHAPFIKFELWDNGGELRNARAFVVPSGSFVDVAIATDRPDYEPKQKARLSVTTNVQGKPVAAEVEVGLVDASLFEFVPDRTHDMRLRFFPPHDPPSDFESILEFKRWRRDDPQGGGGLGGGLGGGGSGGGGWGGGLGGGGRGDLEADPDELARTEIRSHFPDTWHWTSSLVTNPDGKGTLEIDVPDTLARWRIVARAVTIDHQFGSATSSVVTTKPVIIRLAAPRFYVEGDQGVVATVVRNNLAVEQEFLVRFHTSGDEAASAEKKVTVRPKGEKSLDWPVAASRPGELRLRAEALSKAASDAMEVRVPVKPFGYSVPLVKSGAFDENWNARFTLPAGADPTQASLEVTVTGAGPTAIRDALPYLAGYPYGCVEQTMSRFFPAVVAMQAFRRLDFKAGALERDLPEMVRQGLQRLYRFQHEDGGWGWWEKDESKSWMTAYVLFGLIKAKQAGVEVDSQTLQRGLEWLRTTPPTAMSVYVRTLAGEKDVDRFEVSIDNDQDRALLVLAGRKRQALFLPASPPKIAGPHEVQTVAMVILALASVDPKDKAIEPLVNWLLEQRQGSAWHSTLDSAYAVLALTEIVQREDEPKFEVSINGVAARRDADADAGRYLPSTPLKAGENVVEVKRLEGKRVFASARFEYFDRGVRRPAPDRADHPVDDHRPALSIARHVECERAFPDGRKRWERLASGAEVELDQLLRVILEVDVNREANRVLLEAKIPAGSEGFDDPRVEDGWTNFASRTEYRDDRVAMAVEDLGRSGSRTFRFILRPTHPGEYRILPAEALPMYAPHDRAVSAPFVLKIKDGR